MATYKERRNNRCICECGGKYLLANKALHSKTKKHQKWLQTGEVFVSKMPYRISSQRYENLSEKDKAIKKEYYAKWNKSYNIRRKEEKLLPMGGKARQ